jgi:pSer/pThr/pTyr-binding forkhead associated (FHA) protein
MGQLLLKMLVGAVAGLVIWLIFEPMAPALGGARWATWELQFVLCLGLAIGLTVGGLNGWIQGSRAHILRGAGLGFVFGGIGAPLGYQIGGGIATSMFGGAIFVGDAAMPTKMLARFIALAPIGIFLGGAIGASTLTSKRAIQGMIGGFIGAGIGGLVFDPFGRVLSSMSVATSGVQTGGAVETGAPSRALYACLIGGLIALFIGIVDLVARSAWVRLVLGRNEGKEWPIDASQTFIGRNERAGIPLFGDPNIAPMHACITKQGSTYAISDGGSPMGTYVNGQRIQSAPLFHGASIQVGSYQLQFLMKHGAAPVRGPENFNQAYAIQNQPVGAGAPYGAQPVAYPTQQMPSPQGGPPPGSLYGSAPTQAMPAPSGGFPAQQPTVAFPAPGPSSQPTMAYQAVPGGFTLAAIDGPLAGQRYPVRGVIELGRESASVPMSFDSNASRRHASVSPGPMGVMVADLGSTNGTFVNGQRVQSANAGPGDLIKIGGTTFRVEPG